MSCHAGRQALFQVKVLSLKEDPIAFYQNSKSRPYHSPSKQQSFATANQRLDYRNPLQSLASPNL